MSENTKNTGAQNLNQNQEDRTQNTPNRTDESGATPNRGVGGTQEDLQQNTSNPGTTQQQGTERSEQSSQEDVDQEELGTDRENDATQQNTRK